MSEVKQIICCLSALAATTRLNSSTKHKMQHKKKRTLKLSLKMVVEWNIKGSQPKHRFQFAVNCVVPSSAPSGVG